MKNDHSDKTKPAKLLGGAKLLEAVAVAADHLSESAEAINQINVYPVPDSDTGSNMASTLAAAQKEARKLPATAGAGRVLASLAWGAINAGRGNSGLILSQALLGLSKGVGNAKLLDGASLAHGLRIAATEARKAVANPVEGTMLTVLESIAKGAGKANPKSLLSVLDSGLAEAEIASIRTIDQIPALTQAGVTDAGGEGICAIFRGLTAGLRQQTPEPILLSSPKPKTKPKAMVENPGFCLVFSLLPPSTKTVDIDSLRQLLQSEAESVVIAGDRKTLRIHAHTHQPESLLKQAREFGKTAGLNYESLSGRK